MVACIQAHSRIQHSFTSVHTHHAPCHAPDPDFRLSAGVVFFKKIQLYSAPEYLGTLKYSCVHKRYALCLTLA
jgi:hypothetical protein